MAVASFSLRCQTLGVRGRMWNAYHLYDASQIPGAQGLEGLRARVPRNRGKNTTLIATITLEGAMDQRAQR